MNFYAEKQHSCSVNVCLGTRLSWSSNTEFGALKLALKTPEWRLKCCLILPPPFGEVYVRECNTFILPMSKKVKNTKY